MTTTRRRLVLMPIGDDPEVGLWLAALERIDGQTPDEHLGRLAAVRAWVLDQSRPMTNEDFHRVRRLEQYDVAPNWVLHHILQHEAEHRAHIAWLRDTFPGS